MIKNTIALGYSDEHTVKLLPWRNSNGILIAGTPGSGKTYTASWLLAQYAYNGTSLIVADYGASITVEQTLLDSVGYLSPAFLYPPITKPERIVETIERVTALGNDRYTGKNSDHYPIMFVIDEFPAFITAYKPPKTQTTKVHGDRRADSGEVRTTIDAPTFLDTLLESILKLRKVNIHFMIIGQEWAQMSTQGIRAIRSNIGDKLIHRLDKNGAILFGFESAEEKRIIQNLPVGYTYYQSEVLRTPKMTDKVMGIIEQRLQERHWPKTNELADLLYAEL